MKSSLTDKAIFLFGVSLWMFLLWLLATAEGWLR